MSNVTRIYRCSCCGKKFKEHENVYKNPIGLPGKKEMLCVSCYNYKKPLVYKTELCFICLFVLINIIDIVYQSFFSKNEILKSIISYAYIALLPLFIAFFVLVYTKKIVTK